MLRLFIYFLHPLMLGFLLCINTYRILLQIETLLHLFDLLNFICLFSKKFHFFLLFVGLDFQSLCWIDWERVFFCELLWLVENFGFLSHVLLFFLILHVFKTLDFFISFLLLFVESIDCLVEFFRSDWWLNLFARGWWSCLSVSLAVWRRWLV